MTSPFRVVVLNSAGVAQGELITVQSVNDRRTLDEIGTCDFTMAGNDPRAALVVPSALFDIYDEVDGYLGRFYYQSSKLDTSQDTPRLSVKCDDAMVELRRTLTGFKRDYKYEPVELVVEDLVSLVDGWRTVCEPDIGNTTIAYEGESVMAALDELRDRWAQHFRLASNDPNQPKFLEFGEFGVDSGLTVTNLYGQVSADMNLNTNLAVIDRLGRTIDAEEVVNRVIPLGAGQGVGQLTMELADVVGIYAKQTAPNRDGSVYYYLEDAASVAEYGLRPRVVSAPNVRQIGNNEFDRVNAANTIQMVGEKYMLQHLEPRVEYSLTVRALRMTPKVGDLIALNYSGVTDHINWLEVDSLFYLLELERSRSANGDRRAKLKIADSNRKRTSDQDVMLDVVRDIKSLKLHMQPQVWWSENTWLDTVAGWFSFDTFALLNAAKNAGFDEDEIKFARFPIRFDPAVTAIHKVRIQFRTLKHYTTTTYLADFVLSDFYGYFEFINARHYPRAVYMWIDDVDVTALYGGPWGLNDEQVDVSLDISDVILAGNDALTTPHKIEFGCLSRAGDSNIRGVGSGDQNTGPMETSAGIVELNIRIQGTAQAVITE